jgi:hypothetical protein
MSSAIEDYFFSDVKYLEFKISILTILSSREVE